MTDTIDTPAADDSKFYMDLGDYLPTAEERLKIAEDVASNTAEVISVFAVMTLVYVEAIQNFLQHNPETPAQVALSALSSFITDGTQNAVNIIAGLEESESA